LFSFASYAQDPQPEAGFYLTLNGVDVPPNYSYTATFCEQSETGAYLTDTCFDVQPTADAHIFVDSNTQNNIVLKALNIITKIGTDIKMEFGEKAPTTCVINPQKLEAAQPYGIGFPLLTIVHNLDFINGFTQLGCNNGGTHWLTK
jgi:hypothetical protein